MTKSSRVIAILIASSCCLLQAAGGRARGADLQPPRGFSLLFNGKDLSGWHGTPDDDPGKLAELRPPTGGRRSRLHRRRPPALAGRGR